MKKKIDCVVVTYNRLGLLKKCLEALLAQTYALKHIYVVNNGSTDDTYEYLEEMKFKHDEVVPIHLKNNLGGAGGFNRGLKNFIKNSDSDYVWVMDDDTIPTTTALEKLLIKVPGLRNWGFLCSNVRWKDGCAAVMNTPAPTKDWNSEMEKGMVKLTAASFVSILFPRKVIKEVGYPISEFFIWGDDVEYTLRITKNNYAGYLVGNSIVEHKIKKNIDTNIILETDKNRIKRYSLANRNEIYTNRKLGTKKDLIKALLNKGILEPINIIRYSKNYKFYKLCVSIKGTINGFFFNPNIDRKE